MRGLLICRTNCHTWQFDCYFSELPSYCGSIFKVSHGCTTDHWLIHSEQFQLNFDLQCLVKCLEGRCVTALYVNDDSGNLLNFIIVLPDMLRPNNYPLIISSIGLIFDIWFIFLLLALAERLTANSTWFDFIFLLQSYQAILCMHDLLTTAKISWCRYTGITIFHSAICRTKKLTNSFFQFLLTFCRQGSKVIQFYPQVKLSCARLNVSSENCMGFFNFCWIQYRLFISLVSASDHMRVILP